MEWYVVCLAFSLVEQYVLNEYNWKKSVNETSEDAFSPSHLHAPSLL